jgi:class 3 adenylate cyclase
MFVMSTVTAARLMQLKFAEQCRLVGGNLVTFVVLASLSALPEVEDVCAWIAIGALLPLLGIHSNERSRRRAFADNEAMRCRSGVHLRRVQGVTCARARCSASHQQSIELVQAMLPPHITRAMRDGACTPRVRRPVEAGVPTCCQLNAGAPIAATEQRLVALMATDIAGFTSLSAEIGAEEVVQMLDS